MSSGFALFSFSDHNDLSSARDHEKPESNCLLVNVHYFMTFNVEFTIIYLILQQKGYSSFYFTSSCIYTRIIDGCLMKLEADGMQGVLTGRWKYTARVGHLSHYDIETLSGTNRIGDESECHDVTAN